MEGPGTGYKASHQLYPQAFGSAHLAIRWTGQTGRSELQGPTSSPGMAQAPAGAFPEESGYWDHTSPGDLSFSTTNSRCSSWIQSLRQVAESHVWTEMYRGRGSSYLFIFGDKALGLENLGMSSALGKHLV